jgi:NAD(P)-dependent dehydrogenase (short-subunit alcohol dehydrogenase family)
MMLNGKVGIVTGAAQGIGREYALGAARQGACIVVADIEDPSPTVKEIESTGGSAIGVVVDVADEPSTKALAQAALDAFSTVDFLVNNAAIYGQLELKYWEDIAVEEWDRVMGVNVKGQWLCAKAIAPHMTERRSGRIINISSATAHMGTAGACHYVTSKAAVIGLTRVLARELGDFGISVNAITPGFTMSAASRSIMERAGAESLEEMVVAAQCFKRAQQPEDLVGTVVFLASDLSAFITGQVINVDGGLVTY